MNDDDRGGPSALGSADPGFLDELRRQMLRFATLQLNDAALAEDAVQEAFVGALRNAGSFHGTAALRTWVFAILKNKITDVLRQRHRIVYVASLSGDGADDDGGEPAVFDSSGHWRPDGHPQAWSDPQAAMEQSDFWRVFSACLDGLPPRQARVLMMREMIGLDAAAICANAGLTTTNLHVMLHRARLRLRECLENHWFAAGEAPC